MASVLGDAAEIVLLGSIATGKFVEPLLEVFGDRWLGPPCWRFGWPDRRRRRAERSLSAAVFFCHRVRMLERLAGWPLLVGLLAGAPVFAKPGPSDAATPEVVAAAGLLDWHLVGFLPATHPAPLEPFQVKGVPPALLATVPSGGRGDGPPDGVMLAYDLDGDGVPELVTFSQVMYGPSDGLIAYLREGRTLRRAFAISGEWKDARVDPHGVTLRFEANVLEPGEARFSTTLRFDRATRRWLGLLRTFHAGQGLLPAAGVPPVAFVTGTATELRTTPLLPPAEAADAGNAAVVDADPDAGEPVEPTALLDGNVLARLPAGAKGLLLGSSGDFRFVAFSPRPRPSASSLSHGMYPKNEAQPWLCGWIERR